MMLEDEVTQLMGNQSEQLPLGQLLIEVDVEDDVTVRRDAGSRANSLVVRHAEPTPLRKSTPKRKLTGKRHHNDLEILVELGESRIS